MSNKKNDSFDTGVSQNIKNIRKKLNLSQEGLADLTNIDKKRISRIETNKNELTRAEAIAISKLSGDSPADIMFGHVAEITPVSGYMDKVEDYMNEISKKLDLLIRNKSVSELYDEAAKVVNIERYEKTLFESMDEEIDYYEEKHEQAKLYSTVDSKDIEAMEDAVMTCVDQIRFGNGKYAHIAMEVSNSLFSFTRDESYLAERREFAKTYIKHLMNTNCISKKEL